MRRNHPSQAVALLTPRSHHRLNVKLWLIGLLGVGVFMLDEGWFPLATPVTLTPQDPGAVLAREAQKLKGLVFRRGGRHRDERDGLDCMGLCFVALQRAFGTEWKQWPADPTLLIQYEFLGRPVAGLQAVPTNIVRYDLLKTGDIVFILKSRRNRREPSLARQNGRGLWVWHMGIYVGGMQYLWVHADQASRRVTEVPLPAYLANPEARVDAIFVVRPADSVWKDPQDRLNLVRRVEPGALTRPTIARFLSYMTRPSGS